MIPCICFNEIYSSALQHKKSVLLLLQTQSGHTYLLLDFSLYFNFLLYISIIIHLIILWYFIVHRSAQWYDIGLSNDININHEKNTIKWLWYLRYYSITSLAIGADDDVFIKWKNQIVDLNRNHIRLQCYSKLEEEKKFSTSCLARSILTCSLNTTLKYLNQ